MQRCRKCGIDKPFDSFAKNKTMKSGYIKTCKECQIESKTIWVNANTDRLKEYRKAYYASKIPTVIPSGNKICTCCKKEKPISNFGKCKNAYDGLRHQCKDCISAYNKKAGPIYAKANPEKIASTARNRRARERMAEGTHTSNDIHAILIEQESRCKVCYVDVSKGYHVDHVVALVNGGSNWPSNLQILCPTCNKSKGAKDFEEWLNSQKELN